MNLLTIAFVAALAFPPVGGFRHTISVTTDVDRLGKFRYEIYQQEMNDPTVDHKYEELEVDHERQMIVDPRDEHGINIIAEEGSSRGGRGHRITGCIRINLPGEDSSCHPMADFFEIKPEERARSAIVSRFAVGSEFRSSTLAFRLIKFVWGIVYNDPQIDWTYTLCNTEMAKVYHKLGFFTDLEKDHEVYKRVACLKMKTCGRAPGWALSRDERKRSSESRPGGSYPLPNPSVIGSKGRSWVSPGKRASSALASHRGESSLKAHASHQLIEATQAPTTQIITRNYESRAYDVFLRALEVFMTSKAIGKVRDGSLTVPEYKSILREIYFYVREDPQIFGLAAVYLRGAARESVGPFMKHALSEVGHEKLALNDLKKVSGEEDDSFLSVPTLRPLPTTMGLISFAFHQITHRNPIGHLGYLYFLEMLPVIAGSWLIDDLVNKCGIPPEATTFISEHAIADVGHTKLMSKYLEDVVKTEDDFEAVAHAIETTAAMYAVMLDGAIENTEMKMHRKDGSEA